jgi:hypothetical protein
MKHGTVAAAAARPKATTSAIKAIKTEVIRLIVPSVTSTVMLIQSSSKTSHQPLKISHQHQRQHQHRRQQNIEDRSIKTVTAISAIRKDESIRKPPATMTYTRKLSVIVIKVTSNEYGTKHCADSTALTPAPLSTSHRAIVEPASHHITLRDCATVLL